METTTERIMEAFELIGRIEYHLDELKRKLHNIGLTARGLPIFPTDHENAKEEQK